MNSELIKIFCNIFNIPEDSEDCLSLLSFYENSNREISEKEIRFVCAGMRKAKESAKNKVRLRGAECCSDDFRELLSALIARYTSAVSNRDLPIVTNLAEYAASGKIKNEECGIFADIAEHRSFPIPYSGSSESIDTGEIRLTLSYGKPLGGSHAGDICTILSPTADQPTSEFIEKAKCICRDFIKAHPGVMLKAATNDGLISDLSFLSGGYVIDTRLLPTPSETAESIFDVKPPSLLIFPKREDLHELWMTSAIYGITPTAPIASRAKLISIRSGDTSLEFTPDELACFNRTEDVDFKSCDTPVLDGETEVVFSEFELKYSPYLLTAIKVGGENIYESLKEIMLEDNAVFAVSGVLNQSDASMLPLIITLDSFRRNNSPNVIYSRFFMGEKTSLYVFKLSKKK